MGWRSTMYITRQDALKELLTRLLNESDEKLEERLTELSELNSLKIVRDYDGLDEDDTKYCDVGHI